MGFAISIGFMFSYPKDSTFQKREIVDYKMSNCLTPRNSPLFEIQLLLKFNYLR